MVTFLGAKVASWPKVLSSGPEDLNKTGGVDQAQPVDTVNPIGEYLPIKPIPELLSSGAQSTWVLGESSRGSGLISS